MDRYKILLGRSAPKVSKSRPRKKVTRKKKPTLESFDFLLACFVASDEDIAWVRPGREKSGTAKNLKRRIELSSLG
jgi:hypothetical protein